MTPQVDPFLDDERWQPIGLDHWYREYVGSSSDELTIGAILLHKNGATGLWCMGGAMYDIPQAQRYRTKRADGTMSHVWQLLSREPLHVEPSLLCKAPSGPNGELCGDHGWIRGGRWVAA